MTTYHFPLLFLLPDFDSDEVRVGPVRLVKRKWGTSIFDLATLATKHRLHLPYQAMDVFLARCNIELAVDGESSPQEAIETFNVFRLGLYAAGVSPFVSPFLTNYSINEYSGINSRDSENLKKDLHPGMEEGLTSDEGTLEAWPLELSFNCIIVNEKLTVTEATIAKAGAIAQKWRKVRESAATLRAVEDAVNAAPKILPLDQSVLHVWSAIESLFPTVSTEVTFRVSLYLAQLTGEGKSRLEQYETVRSLYGIRSKIAHGSSKPISIGEWQEAWKLLMQACNAVVSRGSLPSEKELLAELLG